MNGPVKCLLVIIPVLGESNIYNDSVLVSLRQLRSRSVRTVSHVGQVIARLSRLYCCVLKMCMYKHTHTHTHTDSHVHQLIGNQLCQSISYIEFLLGAL